MAHRLLLERCQMLRSIDLEYVHVVGGQTWSRWGTIEYPGTVHPPGGSMAACLKIPGMTRASCRVQQPTTAEKIEQIEPIERAR
jgi:hypothetical protein